MRATGIVRRIDELGRVVIPKEIRRTLRMREGDPLELYLTSDNELVMKKYSALGELDTFAVAAAKSLHRASGVSVMICNRDEVVCAAGPDGRTFKPHMPISTDLWTLLSNRQSAIINRMDGGEPISFIEGGAPGAYITQIIVPIESDGEVIGGLIAFSCHPESNLAAVDLAAHALAISIGQQMEV